ncbi:hypothetical protein BLOT_002329 [Blomia tropicalis]|nr:hypothetical protein BLOT_002329 [Blomia tropicalis]
MAIWYQILLIPITISVFISGVSSDDSAIISDEIVYISIDKDVEVIVAGNNKTIVCRVQRMCDINYENKCLDSRNLRWFMPSSISSPQIDRSLVSYNISYEFEKLKTNSTKLATFQITTTLELFQVGFIHQGHYECTSVFEQTLFNIKVKENEQHRCQYHDQCNSYNCYNQRCQCKTMDQNYDKGTGKCWERKSFGESCISDIECKLGNNLSISVDFQQHLSPIKCHDRTCQCDDGDVRTDLATSEYDACLPSVSIGSKCYSNEQCHQSSNGTYCGLQLSDDGDVTTYSLTCQCIDGWRFYNNHCIPYERCNSSELGFNEHLQPGNCQLSDSFCRDNYCICRPNYEFDNMGNCIPQIGMDKIELSFFEQYYYVIMTILIITAIGVVMVPIVLWIRSNRYKRRKRQNEHHFSTS